MEHIDFSLVDWSRAQFALTALYHWIFVPLTLGLSWIIAIMATVYYRTNDPKWKTITRFWLKLFGINFAVGVATGLILEFEFGTNWSTYSWFVGDIFGAPLAVEGILAFFLESTFFAVLFFGASALGARTTVPAWPGPCGCWPPRHWWWRCWASSAAGSRAGTTWPPRPCPRCWSRR